MKVKVNIINTWCILVAAAVSVPSWTMTASIVSDESLARDTQTGRRGLVHLKMFSKSPKTLKTISTKHSIGLFEL